jgi:hypothetical protein
VRGVAALEDAHQFELDPLWQVVEQVEEPPPRTQPDRGEWTSISSSSPARIRACPAPAPWTMTSRSPAPARAAAAHAATSV